MTKLLSLVLSVELLLAASAPSQAQFAPQIIKRGKKATALVDVTFPGGKGNGSAFCIDKSGLFVTNSHVVSRTSGGKGQVHVVIDSGLETHRNLAAKVLRADDVFDLALLKVEAGAELTPLELGNEEMLVETAPIVTFGFPFGRELSGKDNADPEMTVLTGRITSLKRPKGRL
jgi:S1-C subfamily serine protease